MLRRVLAQVRLERVFLVGVTLVAFLLRLFRIGYESLWRDELLTMSYVTNGTPLEILTYAHYTDPHPPTYYLILKGWFAIAPTTPASARMPSVLAATALIPVLYYTGKTLRSDQLGRYMAVLAAVAPPFIFYSQQARMYGFVMLFTGLSLYTTVRYLETPTRRNIVLVVASLLMLAAFHVYAFFTIATVNLLVFDARYTKITADAAISIRDWIVAQVGLGLLLAPWAGFLIVTKLLGDTPNGLEWLTDPSIFLNVVIALRWIVYVGIDHVPAQPIPFPQGFRIVAATIPLLLLYGVFALTNRPKKTRLLLVWLGAPLVLSFVASKLFFPVMFVRYFVQTGVGLYALIALLAVGIQQSNRRTLFVLLFIVALLPSHAMLYSAQNAAWDSVIQQMDDDEDTPIIAVGETSAIAYEYYGSSTDTIRELPKRPADSRIDADRPPPEESFWVLYRSDADGEAVTAAYNTTHEPTERLHDGEVTAVRYEPDS